MYGCGAGAGAVPVPDFLPEPVDLVEELVPVPDEPVAPVDPEEAAWAAVTVKLSGENDTCTGLNSASCPATASFGTMTSALRVAHHFDGTIVRVAYPCLVQPREARAGHRDDRADRTRRGREVLDIRLRARGGQGAGRCGGDGDAGQCADQRMSAGEGCLHQLHLAL